MSIDYRGWVPVPADQVWAWLGRPGAIHRLVPPWQPMTVRREAESLKDGVAVLGVAGFSWTATHLASGYVQGRRFVDQLTSMPLRLMVPWRHEHLVESSGDGSTLIDRVRTPVPGRLLRATFRYRQRQIADDVAAHAEYSRRPLTIAVTGASGTIGRQLCAFLTGGGHRVIRLTRDAAAAAGDTVRHWNPDAPAADLLNQVDAVVHLAGASIAGRFTAGHLRAVRDSRIEPTRRLAQVAARSGVGVFVCASAIGYYGPDRGDDELTEQAARGTGVLADVVADWEDAATGAAGAAVTTAGRMRVVTVRTGLVLTPRGGLLKLLRPVFTLAAGGRIGSGEQWMSWIGIDDLVEIYLRAIVDREVEGPVNAVAPRPVRNRDFTATLASVLHRPAVLAVPALAPRLVLGRLGAEELALASQRVTPQRLVELGHRFRDPDLRGALGHLLGKA